MPSESAPEKLVKYFYKKNTGRDISEVKPKEIEQAERLLYKYKEEMAHFIVDYAIEEAKKTNFNSRITIPVVPFYHTYYNIDSTGLIWRDLNGKVLSFQGSYIEIETDDEVEEIGYILNFDYTKVHSEHWLKSGYPGEKVSPMIISKTIDRGKSIYCATDLEIYSLEYGDSESIEVLTNLVKYVGGEEIELVKIKAPGTVEVNPYVSENSLVIFLLNHTTNQLTTGKAVRYIIPIKDITIEVNWNKRLESAFCLSKSNLDLKREESKIILTLPYLEEYDVIVLKE